MKRLWVIFGLGLFVAAFPLTCLAQSSTPRLALGFKASSLGFGVEAATGVTARSNLRFAFTGFTYNRTGARDGINYDASLNLRSAQVSYDQYLLGGFHVGPGLLLYNGNDVDAILAVPPGQSFTLGGTRYFSNTADPVNGISNVKSGRKTAPMILAGFGNPLPRSSRRIGINFDFGLVFQGSPRTTLDINGTACVVSPTVGCLSAGSDPTVQSNVQAEEDRINEDLRAFKYYPVLSLGISWKF